MRKTILPGLLLLMTAPLYAETYSWVDDNGTYNFTENYSSVPNKFRKKVRSRTDVPGDVKPQVSPERKSAPAVQPEKSGSGQTTSPAEGEKELYGGKTRAEWRAELDAKEAELSRLEKRLEIQRQQMNDTKGLYMDQFREMKKEYDSDRAVYNQKYKSYNELVETVRRAGLAVEIKK